MITRKEAYIYEVANAGFIKTMLFFCFPEWFKRRCNEKYNNYTDFCDPKNIPTERFLRKHF